MNPPHLPIPPDPCPPFRPHFSYPHSRPSVPPPLSSQLWHDLDVLSSNIRGAYADAVEQQLSATLPAAVRAAVRAELENSGASLQQLTEQVAALLADIIADRCADVSKGLQLEAS